MEHNLETVMEEICNQPGVFGCVFADEQGLCIGANGKASNETAGYIAAIANHAAKLEPKNPQSPVIILENNKEKCLIQKKGTITGALYRHT